MIVARIVNNLINGYGWSYNVGEAHNASTSTLNTLLIFLASKFNNEIPFSANLISAIGIFIASVSIFLFLSKKYPLSLSFVTALIIAQNLAFNSTWGIETNLFVGMLFLFIFLEETKYSYVVTGALTLTRPDGVVVCCLKGLKDLVVKKRIPWMGIFIVLAILSPWILFSLLKFGQIFPDTLSSKVWQGKSGLWGHGRIYAKALVEHLSPNTLTNYLVIILSFIGLYFITLRRSPLLYALIFVGIQQATYLLLNVPGYHWYFGALDAAILICACIGGIETLLKMQLLHPVKFLIQSKSIIPALSVMGLIFVTYQDGTNRKDERNESYREAIKVLDSEIKDQESLGTLEVGTIGYYTKRKIVDLAGLASKNPEYLSSAHIDQFYEKPPSVLLLHEPLWHFERGIADDIRFEILFNNKRVIPNPSYPMAYYVRSDTEVSSEVINEFLEKRYPPFLKSEDQNLATSTSSPSCIIDSINGNMRAPGLEKLKNRVLILRGWAVDEIKGRTPSNVSILLTNSKGELFLGKALRHERPDVGTHFKNPALHMAGISSEGSLLSVPSGIYNLKILQRENDKEFIICNTGFEVVIP